MACKAKLFLKKFKPGLWVNYEPEQSAVKAMDWCLASDTHTLWANSRNIWPYIYTYVYIRRCDREKSKQKIKRKEGQASNTLHDAQNRLQPKQSNNRQINSRIHNCCCCCCLVSNILEICAICFGMHGAMGCQYGSPRSRFSKSPVPQHDDEDV